MCVDHSMASTRPPAKSGGRWNFISQAVASVEKGLDSILLEEEERTKKSTSQQVNSSNATASTTPAGTPSDLAKPNDRLQARLAQAMSKGSRSATPDPVSRSQTPLSEADTLSINKRIDSPADSKLDAAVDRVVPLQHESEPADITPDSRSASRTDVDRPRTSSESARPSQDVVRNPRSSSTRAGSRLSAPSPRPSNEEVASRTSAESPSDADDNLLHAQIEHENKQSELQKEIDGYLERIDALQRNIRILTEAAKGGARETIAADGASQHETQLAKRDETIALLVEEGSKLSKNELQYRNTIKTLRVQNTILAREQDAVRQRSEKAERSLAAAQARVIQAESEAKSKDQQITNTIRSQADLEAVKRERDALNTTLSDIRSQLSASRKRAQEVEADSTSTRVELERRLKVQYQEDLESARTERQLSEDKLRGEIEEIKQQLMREKESARQMESEMLAEQAALEGRLESFRARAEEASSNDAGDTHAKLLRQVETLQQQYVAASQNWQGIEGTLLARIGALEKDRDDAKGIEMELRRKLRDATTKVKNATKELEEAQSRLHTLEDETAQKDVDIRQIQRRNEHLEQSLSSLQKEFEAHKSRTEVDFARRLEEERTRWLASLPPPVAADKLDSPMTASRKSHGNLISLLDRSHSRRPSIQPYLFTDPNHSLTRMASSASIRVNGLGLVNSTTPETPSIISPEGEADEFFNVPPTPASHITHDDSAGKGRNLNDIMSTSTLGAGPSIQLVERLSTTVRRLETEKAASKDELTRLTTQRDEARHEVVNLMREVEAKRTNDAEIKKLTDEHAELLVKYQAMLELLGEKTEQVEELKADVADVKTMYRELVDTMGRDK